LKTLYISDLDGTLLNKNVELSDFTVSTLNQLIHQGVNFTVATARTIASVSSIMAPVALNLPVILMNGVLVYDMPSRKYINTKYLPTNNMADILHILKDHNLTGFMYEVKDQKLATYYERLETRALRDFHDERVNRYQKPFTKVASFADANPEHIIYFSLMDTKERLESAYQAMQGNSAIATAFYKDIYSTEDIWFLEVFSAAATKYNAAMYLRDTLGYDNVIGFGDNVNDLPLFKACDITCAVANAREEVKEAATHVIESNLSDGVPRWLMEHSLNNKGVPHGKIG
jgi:Cof subfamily protein (haloacid dehalogenase superfamily)